ncbi:MAG: hypothetical protein LUI60_05220 [Clostridia bacterium]|nr:hypothetical protein [Clostridia bacterium]
MVDWYNELSVLGKVYLWIAVVATVLLVVQIILLLFSSFGGDIDADGDGDIDVDGDSGVSIFTLKSITAFFAVGCWAGLLTCSLTSESLQWVSILVAIAAGGLAMATVTLIIRAMLKLQCNGIVDFSKLAGRTAVVYVSIPPARSGRGKITITTQGKYMEVDAVTEDGERIACDQVVEITSVENECAVVTKSIQTTVAQNGTATTE